MNRRLWACAAGVDHQAPVGRTLTQAGPSSRPASRTLIATQLRGRPCSWSRMEGPGSRSRHRRGRCGCACSNRRRPDSRRRFRSRRPTRGTIRSAIALMVEVGSQRTDPRFRRRRTGRRRSGQGRRRCRSRISRCVAAAQPHVLGCRSRPARSCPARSCPVERPGTQRRPGIPSAQLASASRFRLGGAGVAERDTSIPQAHRRTSASADVVEHPNVEEPPW